MDESTLLGKEVSSAIINKVKLWLKDNLKLDRAIKVEVFVRVMDKDGTKHESIMAEYTKKGDING